MKYLIDTNIILDVLLKRKPFYNDSADVLNLSGQKDINLYVTASSITDIYYIAYQTLRNKEEVREMLVKLLKIVLIAGVSGEEIRNALELTWKDFEDSVQYSVALLQEMDGIVTRNPSDYKGAEMKVWNPKDFLTLQSI